MGKKKRLADRLTEQSGLGPAYNSGDPERKTDANRSTPRPIMPGPPGPPRERRRKRY